MGEAGNEQTGHLFSAFEEEAQRVVAVSSSRAEDRKPVEYDRGERLVAYGELRVHLA